MSRKFNKNFKKFKNNNLNTLHKYNQNILSDQGNDSCSNCIDYCQNCNSKRFQRNFDKWTSGNKYIDKFIQDAQLTARTFHEVIEWIPYNRLRNIKYLTKGGFSTIYEAIWLGGNIIGWDNKAQTWYRDIDIKSLLNKNETKGRYVVLKSLNNSSNINDDFLNEVSYFL